MKKKLEEIVFQTVIVGLVTVALLLVLEFGVRAVVGDPILRREQKEAFIQIPPDDRARSLAYQSIPWAQDFFEETKLGPSRSLEYSPFRLWKERPFKNKYVTYDEAGFRLTVSERDRSCSKVVRIFFFGGSTMAGAGFLRDVDTIPSIVFGLSASGDSSVCYEMRNFGQSGYNQGNEYVLLMELLSSGERPDIVVFYDGANDVWHRVLMGHPHMSFGLFRRVTGFWEGIDSVPGFLETAVLKLARRSAVVSLFLSPSERPAIATSQITKGELRRRANDVARLYCGNMNVVRAVGEIFGFRTLLVLQPVLFFKKHKSPEEIRLVEGYRIAMPSLSDAYETTYESVRRRFAEDSGCGRISDLSGALDETLESVYVDAVHMSPVGNSNIAEALLADLRRRGWM